MKRVDVAIVGAGPAGMVAASTAASNGLSIAWIDDQPDVGGKVLQKAFLSGKISDLSKTSLVGIRKTCEHELSKAAGGIERFFGTQVWEIEQNRTLHLAPIQRGASCPSAIKAEAIVLAEGAVERHVPFPGWTLPGVMAAGGLGLFVKRGIIPGHRVFLAGSGLLQLALLRDLAQMGLRPAGISLPLSFAETLAFFFGSVLWMGSSRLLFLAAALYDLMRSRIPVYFRSAVTEADGEERLSAVRLQSIDPKWRPIANTGNRIPADTLAIGYGIQPSCDLSRLCGCLHIWEDNAGYWKPLRDRWLETSAPGIWAAGDGARIAGYESAWLEGQIAGLAVCASLGNIPPALAEKRIKPLLQRLAIHDRMAKRIDALSRPRDGIWNVVTDNTIICRCESVRAGDIRKAVASGAQDIGDIKRRTRLGMGPCQARFCTRSINELLARYGRKQRIADALFRPRTPAKPVRFENMAEDVPQALSGDSGRETACQPDEESI
ncbi:NAD(P)/FAD-dependent oxidoreductase [Desulfatirhabdium butyrativorans]|uniref:NAD(P)/FAD-dependent oxidoreductase n=1 Tax=Desulfatirhabdium butyrativorans TaxID=340467 RepID=UPI0004178659|nr:NAD(P)/FAD-dependent oxidoreductase [Desulfatirhabdium butyrativorans]